MDFAPLDEPKDSSVITCNRFPLKKKTTAGCELCVSFDAWWLWKYCDLRGFLG